MGKTYIAVAALAAAMVAAPASAAVTVTPASSGQGTLVHGTGPEQTALTVFGNLGAGGPTIVAFTGDTTETSATSDRLRLQNGQGQADVTGAEITLGGPANDLYNILSGNIFLTQASGLGIDYIEFGLTTGAAGAVNFLISTNEGDFTFNNQAIGNGNTFFAFNTTGNTVITNVRYTAVDPLQINLLKQVRIDTARLTAAVPEPGTWALMLLGFGGIGVSMRRRRSNVLMQVA